MLTASRTRQPQFYALPAALSRGTALLPEDPLPSFVLDGAQHELGKLEVVAVDGQPAAPRAIRITTSAGSRTPWDVQVRAVAVAPIHAGDVLLARFSIRCIDSATGQGAATFVLELPQTEWDKAVEFRAEAGAQWEHYVVPFRTPRSFKPGEAMICFRAGFDQQTVEISGVELINYAKGARVEDLPRTPVGYAGREPDAAWRREATERIDKHRKADLAIRVTDAAGIPLAGATVHAKMVRHAFGFGSALSAEHLLGETPDHQQYRSAFETLFNRAVFENDMKWQQTWDGVPDRVERAMAWLQQRQIPVRGHCLLWPSWRWLPKDLRALAGCPPELRRAAAERCTEMVRRFQGRLYQWDVINEAYANHDLMDLLGQEVMVEWFKLAHAADPECKLYLNDYGIICGGGDDLAHQDSFYSAIRFLQDHEAPIHGIGIQSHFNLALTPPLQLLRVLDRFSELGLPIESTELSLSLNDRELQADYMRDYLIALFSHPNVQGIMLWGFWEGRHWRPEGALYGRDWKLRPHGQVWADLVHNQWTTEVQSTTDLLGQTQFRGFCGDYELTVRRGGSAKTIRASLPQTGREMTIALD